MCGRCGISSMTSTSAVPGLALGGYHGARQPSRITRSASFASGASSPPACSALVRGKLAHSADCGSTTGIASSSASSASAANAPGSRPAVSIASTGFRAPASSAAAASTSSGAATVRPGGGAGRLGRGRLPVPEQYLHRRVHVHRPGRSLGGELAGPLDHPVQHADVGRRARPLGERRGHALRAAGDRQVPVPLGPGVRARGVAVRRRTRRSRRRSARRSARRRVSRSRPAAARRPRAGARPAPGRSPRRSRWPCRPPSSRGSGRGTSDPATPAVWRGGRRPPTPAPTPTRRTRRYSPLPGH